jgi:hypothetical protein
MMGGLALAALVATRAAAQNEDVLRRFFEGKTVLIKLDLPGSERGVDVYPGTSRPIDFPTHAKRLKEFGTAVRRGQEVLITKVKVKKDLIEFQLGGGGYGTFGDDAGSSVYVPAADKTQREKNLEKDIPGISDPSARRKAQEELDQLRKDRSRTDAANRAQAAQASQLKEANLRQKRAEGGSRFNLRYDPEVPDEARTPDGMMRALAEYVDFGPMLSAGRPGLHGEGEDRLPGDLRKGMLVEDVDRLLGRPDGIAQRMEGNLRVSVSIYTAKDRKVEAEFVEGVLIRFTVSSR